MGGEETSHMTLNDKSDLFFHDYSFGPLFVQENYVHVTPFAARYVGGGGGRTEKSRLKQENCLFLGYDNL